MEDDDDTVYIYVGTPLEDESETQAKSWKKVVKDPSLTRSLPVHKQEAVDDQGRRRFHGAFTGGFSAGFYNTVGSKEGWQPSTFKSSRAERTQLKQQSVDDFLDEDERADRQKSAVRISDAYDTFGDRAAAEARARAQADASARPSLIPGGSVLDELVVPVASGIGMRLLQKLGWRPGRGIGMRTAKDVANTRSKWGTVAGVSLENTPLYVLEPKQDAHGLGFDPFEDAEEFRARKRARTTSTADPSTSAANTAQQKKAQRGIAFGTGVLEDSDTLGYMADYVDHEGGGRDRLARLEAFNFEVLSEEDDEDRFDPRKKRPLRLEGSGAPAPMYLQSKQQVHKHGSFILGFKLAADKITPPHFPPPQVPPDFQPRHVFPLKAASASQAPPPLEAPPPL